MFIESGQSHLSPFRNNANMCQSGHGSRHVNWRLGRAGVSLNIEARGIPVYYHKNGPCFSNFMFCFLVPTLDSLNKIKPCSSFRVLLLCSFSNQA